MFPRPSPLPHGHPGGCHGVPRGARGRDGARPPLLLEPHLRHHDHHRHPGQRGRPLHRRQ